jgi:hypothetical protein
MGPIVFKYPSLLGEYHGAPPLLHPSAQVCAVSSNGTDMGDSTHPKKASPHTDVLLVEKILPQEFLENPTPPLIPDFPPPRVENPSLGDSPSSHYSNSLLLPPT